MSKNIVAIGDIHGCARSLKSLWKKLEPHENALHVFIGDYIDRGPSSKEVVNFLLDVRNERECVFLRGNHEQMLLDALNKNDITNWMYNGGETTLKSYNGVQSAAQLPGDHITFYEETLPYFESDDYFFVHAGIPPHQTIEASKDDPAAKDFFLWGREHLNAFETPWEKTVVFGHTPRPHPIKKTNMIGIDTGCVYNKLGYGKLTAVVLPETVFIQQISLD
ncbi:MAG: metallophosphoesterase family protein [Balneolaceae bacterium]